MDEGGILVQQKLLHGTYDLIIVSKNGNHAGGIWV